MRYSTLLAKLASIGGLVLTIGLLVPTAANAFSNGQACPPYWTEDTPPAASFGFAPLTPTTQVSVSFDASASTSGTAFKWTYNGGDAACESSDTSQSDPISAYKWTFGDGTTETDAGPTTSHTYASAGTYTVTLVVQEKNGRTIGTNTTYFTNTMTQQLKISDQPPAAAFTESTSVSTGQVANFDASASSDPDGTITNYHWDFGDGQTLDTSSPTTAHIYTTPGVKTVTLTVTDNDGSSGQAQHSYTVLNRPPVAVFTVPTSSTTGQAVRFDGSASSDPDGTIANYHWDFGDGQTENTTSPTTSHTYTTPGNKTVTLTVTDNSGSTDQVQHPVGVQAAQSTGNSGGNPGGSAGAAGQSGGPGSGSTGGKQGATNTLKCVAPNLHGDKLAKARKLLARNHCRLGTIKHSHAPRHQRGRVITQSVKQGHTPKLGRAVSVTIGR
jgi:PKD repeat protein